MVTKIEPSTIIKGKLNATEEIVVEGRIEGEVATTEKVVVTKGAIVKGPIICREIEIGGIVEGEVWAKECAKLLSYGKIQGDLKTGHLFVADGAILAGKVATDGRSVLLLEEPETKKK